MGSWSVKCAVSHLPITAGNDIVLLLGAAVKGRKGYDTGGFVYQPHFFNLLAPPIFGKYNDYGWIEECEDDHLAFASDVLKLIWGKCGPKGVEGPINPFDDNLIPGEHVKVARSADERRKALHFDALIGCEGTLLSKGKDAEYDYVNVEFPFVDETKTVMLPVEMIDILPRIPAIDDISGDVHWCDLQGNFREFLHENYDYAFIHRKVWDALVEGSKKNFMDGPFMGSRDDDDASSMIKAAITAAGGRIGKYSPYAFPQQFFEAGLALWPKDIEEYKKPNRLRILLNEGIPQPVAETIVGLLTTSSFDHIDLDEAISCIKNAQIEINDELLLRFANAISKLIRVESRYNIDQLMRVSGSRVGLLKVTANYAVSWFEPAFTRNYDKLVNIEYVDSLLKLLTTPARKDLVMQAQLVLTAVSKAGIAIRGHEDTPSEQQCGGPYWPHMAIHKAALDVMLVDIEEKVTYRDEDEGTKTLEQASTPEEKRAALIALLESDGLDESYEFKD